MKHETPTADCGVIVGRFQVAELHEGHRALIEGVMGRHKKVIILLGREGHGAHRFAAPGLVARSPGADAVSDRMIPVPESSLRALAEWQTLGTVGGAVIDSLVACLPEPEPTFTDEEALAFYRAMWGRSYSTTDDIKYGRSVLSRLADAKWTAPKALCPPPSPALVEVVEAARAHVQAIRWDGPLTARLHAAVAAYDEEEETP